MQSSADTLHWYEKTALGLGMAAQSLVVTRWYLNDVAPPIVMQVLLWVTVVVAVLAGIAFDAVMVVTTMGRREGRVSPWGWATALAASVFSAAVALHVHGDWSAGPWLHVGYPVVTFLFAQHLAAPRKAKVSEVEQLTQWLEQSRVEIEQARADAEQREHVLHEYAARAGMAESENENWRTEGKRVFGLLEQAQQRIEQLEAAGELDKPTLAQRMNAQGMTVRQIGDVLNVSVGTVSKWTKPTNGKVAEGITL